MIRKEDLPDWFVPGARVVVIGDSVCHDIRRDTFLTLGEWHSTGLYLRSKKGRGTWVSYKDVTPIAPKSVEELL